jgi:hypothetical protein
MPAVTADATPTADAGPTLIPSAPRPVGAASPRLFAVSLAVALSYVVAVAISVAVLDRDSVWFLVLAVLPLGFLLVGAAVLISAYQSRPMPVSAAPLGLGTVISASRRSSALAATQTLTWGVLVGMVVQQWTSPERLLLPELRTVHLVMNVGLTSAVALMTLVVVGTTVTVFAGRPRIEIAPDALVVRTALGRRTFPWSALAPGVVPTHRGVALTLAVRHPELVVRRGVGGSVTRIRVDNLGVDPRLLAATIAFYADHYAQGIAAGQ